MRSLKSMIRIQSNINWNMSSHKYQTISSFRHLYGKSFRITRGSFLHVFVFGSLLSSERRSMFHTRGKRYHYAKKTLISRFSINDGVSDEGINISLHVIIYEWALRWWFESSYTFASVKLSMGKKKVHDDPLTTF